MEIFFLYAVKIICSKNQDHYTLYLKEQYKNGFFGDLDTYRHWMLIWPYEFREQPIVIKNISQVYWTIKLVLGFSMQYIHRVIKLFTIKRLNINSAWLSFSYETKYGSWFLNANKRLITLLKRGGNGQNFLTFPDSL